MWFNKLMGFEEISPENVKNNISIDGTVITSKVNGKSYECGIMETPTLSELRERCIGIEELLLTSGEIKVSELVGDVQQLHCKPENENALFQAASQFNLLEMAGPQKTPELGVNIYDYDYTQGPACAIACGAGTIYRNYFIPLGDQIGQSVNNQINCLSDVEKALDGNWSMVNGYALISLEGLRYATRKINRISNPKARRPKDGTLEEVKDKLRIGLQWYTEVTLADNHQLVSQAYCSALPVAYCGYEEIEWEALARVVLEATYEATLYSALHNYKVTGCNKVFLTLVGGGAFGNNPTWIFQSLLKALKKFKNYPLDVKIVSYEQSNPMIRQMIGLI